MTDIATAIPGKLTRRIKSAAAVRDEEPKSVKTVGLTAVESLVITDPDRQIPAPRFF